MENILLNFQSDTSSLDVATEKLEQVESQDKAVADQAKKTMAAYEARDKALIDTLNKVDKSLDTISASFKNLDKIVVGGAFNKAMETMSKAILGMFTNSKTLSAAIDFAKKKLDDFKPGSDEWKDLNLQITEAQKVLASFGEEEEKTGQKTTSLRAQLRSLKQDIASKLESSGGAVTPEIQELIDKAGELDDRLKDINQTVSNTGSDTRTLQGLIGIVSAGVGAFSALQGSMQLFGGETDETQKALQKLFAVMSILQGLEQIQNATLEESAAMRLISNVQRKAAVAYANLETAAESRNIVVKGIAIVTQRALNLVMAASPAGLLLTAISAVAGALVYFTTTASAAAKAQAELNTALKSANEGLDSELTGMSRASEKILAEMKKRGASDNDLTKREIANADLRNAARQREVTDRQADLERLRAGGKVDAEELNKLSDRIFKIQQDIVDESTNQQVKVFELQRQQYLQSLKSAQSYAESRLAIVKQGSVAELRAQQEAIRQQANTQLLSNPNLTAGERVKIEADSLRQIAELQYQ